MNKELLHHDDAPLMGGLTVAKLADFAAIVVVIVMSVIYFLLH